ncbi:hypothetical protein [Streptomyces sp. ADI91-18]|uniref:hypothetical protein n=1 Tax=Streptomyces sp. ADI91-18 TaxID=1522755 RepID=UPI003216DEFB
MVGSPTILREQLDFLRTRADRQDRRAGRPGRLGGVFHIVDWARRSRPARIRCSPSSGRSAAT